MPRYRVVHTNTYSFGEAVHCCSLEARLYPCDNEKQTIEFGQSILRPLAKSQTDFTDAFGNHVSQFDINTRLQSIELTAIHTVCTKPPIKVTLSESMAWEKVRDKIDNVSDLSAYKNETSYVSFNESILNYALVSFTPDRPILEAAFNLMQRLFQDFQFDQYTSNVNTTAQQAFKQKSGVCQDFTHVAIACLRSLKLPARYVSGYVDTKLNSSKPKSIASDVSHAWFSVYDPGFEWVDFDSTNNKMPDEFYIILAYGRDYKDIEPLKGYVDYKGNNQLSVNVDLTVF